MAVQFFVICLDIHDVVSAMRAIRGVVSDWRLGIGCVVCSGVTVMVVVAIKCCVVVHGASCIVLAVHGMWTMQHLEEAWHDQ